MLDVAGAIAQLFAYDAYGQAIGFNPADALTEFLYSGEQFDAKIGQQYLRARYYDPATGTFNRLDPFFGNLNDPQSLHNYLYAHSDPITLSDPSGLFAGVAGIGVGMGMASGIRMAATTVYSGIYEGSMLGIRGLEAYMKEGEAGVNKVLFGYIRDSLLTLGVGFAVLKGIPWIGSFITTTFNSVRRRIGVAVKAASNSRIPSAVVSMKNADLLGYAPAKMNGCFIAGTEILLDVPWEDEENLAESNSQNGEKASMASGFLNSNEIVFASLLSLGILLSRTNKETIDRMLKKRKGQLRNIKEA